MMLNWLRAIFRPREDDGRIAFLKARMSNLEYEKDKLMSRLDDLSAVVTEVGGVVDAVIAHVNDLTSRLSVAGVEDPRIGEAADALRTAKERLAAIVPAPAPVDAPAPADAPAQ